MFHHKKILVLLLVVASFELYGQSICASKGFDIESALINYDINGSGKLSADSQLEISGKSTLVFTEWGARKLYKEKVCRVNNGNREDHKNDSQTLP